MRLKYIDAVKGLGMLFIMWGHIINFYEYASWWGSSFKIVVFYTVSGYLLSLRSKNDADALKTPVKKLVASLGIPYVFYSLAALTVALAAFLMGAVTGESVLEKLVATLTFAGVSTLWFLPSMFIGRVLFDLSYRHKIKGLIRVILLLLIPLLLCLVSIKLKELSDEGIVGQGFLGIPVVLLKGVTAFWFVSVGFESGLCLDAIKQKYRVLLSVTAVAIASVLAFTNRGIDLNCGDFGVRPIMFFVTGTLFSLGLTEIFKFLGNWIPFRFLSFVGRNSLFIMATHLPLYIVPAVSAVVDKFFVRRTMTLCYIRSFIILISVLVIESVLIVIKNRAVRFIRSRTQNQKIKKLISYI